MSDLPSHALSYRTVVAEYFLALRGSGLMLSPLDQEQVATWERRGLPVAVVCRGLRRGFEELRGGGPPASAPPRSLRACRGAVEAEWRAYRSGRVGDAPAPPSEEEVAASRLAAARALLDDATRASPPRLRGAYAAALARLGSASRGAAAPLDDADARIVAADAVLLGAWIRCLPAPERAALGRRVALRAGPRPPRVRPAAHRETLRSYVLDAARAAGLLCLRGSV